MATVGIVNGVVGADVFTGVIGSSLGTKPVGESGGVNYRSLKYRSILNLYLDWT